MTISTLIASPSPRDIVAFNEHISTIKGVPKLFVKYWPEEFAYDIIKNYFLKHTDAEYLVITPDDLLAHKYHYDKLVETIEKYGKENMPTLSGVCNVHNVPSYLTQLAICVDRPIAPIRRHRNYKWADLRNSTFRAMIQNKDRIQVKFSGFPFQFIRRDIIEKIGLDADLDYNPNHRIREGYSIDVVFCHLCNENNIPLYVNPWVQMLHLRGSKNTEYPGIEPIKVWSADPKVFIQSKEDAVSPQDITSMFRNHLMKYNEKRSLNAQVTIPSPYYTRKRIVPTSPRTQPNNDHNQNVLEARVPRQDSRSAGRNQRRDQRQTVSQNVSAR